MVIMLAGSGRSGKAGSRAQGAAGTTPREPSIASRRRRTAGREGSCEDARDRLAGSGTLVRSASGRGRTRIDGSAMFAPVIGPVWGSVHGPCSVPRLMMQRLDQPPAQCAHVGLGDSATLPPRRRTRSHYPKECFGVRQMVKHVEHDDGRGDRDSNGNASAEPTTSTSAPGRTMSSETRSRRIFR